MSDGAIAAIPGIESFMVTPESFGTSLRISIARDAGRGGRAKTNQTRGPKREPGRDGDHSL